MYSIVLVVITGPVFVRRIKCIVLSWYGSQGQCF